MPENMTSYWRRKSVRKQCLSQVHCYCWCYSPQWREATADDNEGCADCEGHGREGDPWCAANTASTVGNTGARTEDTADDRIAAENKCRTGAEVSELAEHFGLVGSVPVGTVGCSLDSAESFGECAD